MEYASGTLPRGRAESSTRERTPFVRNRPLQVMIVSFVYIWGLLAKSPVDRSDWLLENVLPVVFLAILAFMYRRFAFSNVSYLLLVLFFILHAVGAHYSYQYTPLDTWYKMTFHAERSIYDRVVHCSFGLLVMYPMREIAERVMKLRGVWLYVVPFAIVMAFSALFEIGEMYVALLANPQLAAQYLGLQGDPLDTAKDMSMALYGALASTGLIALLRLSEDRWRGKIKSASG